MRVSRSEVPVLPNGKRQMVRDARAKGDVMAVTSMIVHPVSASFVDDKGDPVYTVTLIYNEGLSTCAKATLDKYLRVEGNRFSERDAFRLAHEVRGYMFHGLTSDRVKIQHKPFHMEDYQRERIQGMAGKKTVTVTRENIGLVSSTSVVKADEEFYPHACACGSKIPRRKGPGRPPTRCSECATIAKAAPVAKPKKALDSKPDACYDHKCSVCDGPIPRRKGPGRPPTKCPSHQEKK